MIYEKNPADKPEHTKKTTPQGSGVVSTILIAVGTLCQIKYTNDKSICC